MCSVFPCTIESIHDSNRHGTAVSITSLISFILRNVMPRVRGHGQGSWLCGKRLNKEMVNMFSNDTHDIGSGTGNIWCPIASHDLDLYSVSFR